MPMDPAKALGLMAMMTGLGLVLWVYVVWFLWYGLTRERSDDPRQ